MLKRQHWFETLFCMQSLILTLINGGILGGILACWPRMLLITYVPVLIMLAANFHLTRARVSDFFTFAGARESPTRSLWYLWTAFMAFFLLRQFVQNLEFQKENAEVGRLFASVDFGWKNLVLFISVANLMVWNRRQTYSERWASLLIAFGVYAIGNLIWDVIRPYQSMEVFGESRIEGKEARWMPPLARSNAYFAYMCSTAVSAAVAWGLCRIQKRKISALDWGQGIMVGVTITAAAWCAVKLEFRSNVAALVATVGMAMVPFLRRRAFTLYGLLAMMIIFPLLFFTPLGHIVLNAMSPEKLTMAAGAGTSEDATLDNRTYLWEYAARRLAAHPEVVLIGDGPVMRDAMPGYLGAVEGYRASFHSASIDFLMSHGIFVAAIAVWCLARMIHLLYQRPRPHHESPKQIDGFDPCILYFAACFVISIVDPGISNFEGFSLAMLPGFGLLLEVERRRVRALKPTPRPATLSRPARREAPVR